MFNKLQVNRLSRIALLLFVSMFFSLNSYAVKRSAAGISTNEVQKSSAVKDKKNKPNVFQRFGLKVLTKRIEKKVAKMKVEAEKAKGPKKGMAIAALVLGVFSFLFLIVPSLGLIGFATAILAVIFGGIGRKRAKENPEEFGGKGMALGGMILGIVLLGLFLLGIIFVVLLFSAL